MTLDELARRIAANPSTEIEVRAVDPMIYVVYVLEGERRVPIGDDVSRARQFGAD